MRRRPLLFLLSLALVQSATGQLSVTSVSPAAHVISAPRATDITVAFGEPVNPSTVDSSTFKVYGRWSGPAAGTFQFLNGNSQVRFNPTTDFFAGEWVTVTLSSSVLSATGETLSTGYAWGFWTATAQASLEFESIGQLEVREENEGPIVSYGAFAGDLDGDGWTDLTVPNEGPNDVRVFMNTGAGSYPPTFATVDLPGSGRPSANEGGDFDGDGSIDIAVGGINSTTLSVLLNDGDGGFSDVTGYTTVNDVRGVCVLDYDADGDDDIVTASRAGTSIDRFTNDGTGSFSSAGLITVGSGATSCAAADANNDGITDLFVGVWNDDEVVLLLGDGNSGFTESDRVGINGDPTGVAWQLAAGDVNLDGNVDVASVNANKQSVTILLGDGAGNLAIGGTYPTDPFALAVDLGDLDGDGDLDMVVSAHSGGRWQVYENDGNGSFGLPINYNAPDRASCTVLHDRDNDGDLDVTGVDEGADVLVLFRTVQGPVGTEEFGDPVGASLSTAYPNPFVADTELILTVARDQQVVVELYDALGRLVRVLQDTHVAARTRVNVNVAGGDLAPGVYFVRATGADFSISRALVRPAKN
jgi:hypothetical protein